MQYADIRKAILNGALDAQLPNLQKDLRAREQALAAINARELQPGDVVTIHGLRPAYINGQEATIIRVNKTRVVVTFNNPNAAGRFAHAHATIPLTNITPTGAKNATA